MKGDFSRIRFTPEKNYTAVLQQQGRVALDADANEQTAIDAYLRDTTNVDLIGSHGAPANDAGFGINIENGKIRIGRGRYYVDGILVENDRDRDYCDQPFLIPTTNPPDPSSESSLITALESGTNVQFVLQVWRRFVTELDDPCLVEPAIGQADTTARLQTIWRVIGTASDMSLAAPATPATSNAADSSNIAVTSDRTEAGNCNQNPIERLSSCCQSLYQERPEQHTGKMTAKTNPGGDDCGCQPIPAAGYQGLENQLYRVEIHTGGPYSEATFKWSRENASVVAQVTGVNGMTVTLNSLGPDANLGFQVNQWVELSDDTYLFGDTPNQPGVLYQISALGPGPSQVTLSGTPSVNTSRNARMRRWDQPMTAPSTGIPVSSVPVTLEYGIEVTFSQDGNFVSGDYWTIPARTANGQIDWACGSQDDPFLPPQYFSIYQAPLACAQLSPDNPPPATGAATDAFLKLKYVVQDCRIKFPPLTAITCGDGGPCTIVPKPGAGWEAPLLALKKGANADICFPVGNFPLTQPVILTGLGSLRLSGGGYGTQIVATGVSAALIFDNCASVQISDLAASTDTVLIRKKRKGTPALGGTLSFADCVEVSIDSVSLKCGFAEERTAACITVQNSFVQQTMVKKVRLPLTGSYEVRIRHCNLEVGGGQEGILLVRVGRAQIEDNTLVAAANSSTLSWRLQSLTYRAKALRVFFSGAQYVKAAVQGTAQPEAKAAPAAQPAAQPSAQPAAQPSAESVPAPARETPAGTAPETTVPTTVQQEGTVEFDDSVLSLKSNATVTFNGHTLQFRTHPLLKDFWQTYVAQNAPKTIANNRDLLLFIKKTVRSFLLNPKLVRGNTPLISALASIDKADQVAMGRAISVGGEGIQECRILNNSIHDAVQGITVGMSNHKEYPFIRESAGTVTIAGNQIYVGMPPGTQFHNCQAIFVGNVNSLMVENNFAAVLTNPDLVTREGIRVWGVLGPKVIVRHSHLSGVEPGIIFRPLVLPKKDKPPLWLVADNMAELAGQVVHPPVNVFSGQPQWINNLSGL